MKDEVILSMFGNEGSLNIYLLYSHVTSPTAICIEVLQKLQHESDDAKKVELINKRYYRKSR